LHLHVIEGCWSSFVVKADDGDGDGDENMVGLGWG
jgi:hypothetical protein